MRSLEGPNVIDLLVLRSLDLSSSRAGSAAPGIRLPALVARTLQRLASVIDAHRSISFPPHCVPPARLLTVGKAFLVREHQFHFIRVGRTDSHYSHENHLVHQVNALLLDPSVKVMRGLHKNRNSQ